ncbi:hypothetical protein LMG27198_51600 [Methylocystis echinoides]|uniref:Uncharacterized protein n=1 Tax=Methylocystis echinoides TaxID=29468 RepID=A0A9W6H054_9HYPH|nr:hypothetical protein LMG27198_51600 [Methylocystis echinoides]
MVDEGIRGEDHGREHDQPDLLTVAVALIGIARVARFGRPVLLRVARVRRLRRALGRSLPVIRAGVVGRQAQGRSRDESREQRRRVNRELRPAGILRDREKLGIASGDLVDEGAEIAASHRAVQDIGRDDVAAVDPGEMHDGVAIRPAEDEPGVRLVAQALLAADLQAGSDQGGLEAVEFRELLLRPAALARRCGSEERDDRAHRDLTSAQ